MKLLALFVLFGCLWQPAKCQVFRDVAGMETEHLSNPLGIDAAHPRFSWVLGTAFEKRRQLGYEVVVGTDSAAVAAGKGNIWNSGRHAGELQLMNYAGTALEPFTRYYWGLQVWDSTNLKYRSLVAWFETGMMDQKNWKGAWITDKKDIKVKPAAYFRHDFRLGKEIVSARVYIAAAGLYELTINGKRVG